MNNQLRIGLAIGLAVVLIASVGALAVRILTVDITPYQSANVVEVTDGTFEKEVLNSDIPVIVEFYRTNNKTCLRFQPVFHKAADQNVGKVKFVAIDVDKNPGIVNSFGVQKIPTLMFIKKGPEAGDYKLGTSEGFHSASELSDLLDLCMKPDAPLTDVKISTRAKDQGTKDQNKDQGKESKDQKTPDNGPNK